MSKFVGALARPPASYPTIPKRAWATDMLLYHKRLANVTFAQVAARVGLSEVYATSAVYGQQQLSKEEAQGVCSACQLPEELVPPALHLLTQPVLKGHLGSGGIPTDPCEYRLYEILQVYGSTFHALVSPTHSTALITPARTA